MLHTIVYTVNNCSTMRYTLCTLFACVAWWLPTTEAVQSAPRSADIVDYCNDDIFNPSCGEDEVIVVKHARYGRMRRGRCIPSSDNVGCSVDVRGFMDKTCSGRKSCEIPRIPSIARQYESQCGDMKEYLEVALECIKVTYSTKKDCGHSGAVEVRSERGFLSSLITHQTGCGSQTKPWWITAKPGQQIRLRLFDFAADPSSASSRHIGNVCQVYAKVKETSKNKDGTVCASNTRNSLVYTSESNQIEVQLITGAQMESQFLIEFEVFGCADPKLPANGWLKRRGIDVTWGCNDNSEDVWELRCEGAEWIGKRQNCTAAEADATTDGPVWMFRGKYQALSIMIIIGVVICVCLCILLFVVIYVKRNWKKGPRIPQVPGTNKNGRPLLDDRCADDYYGTSALDYSQPKPDEHAAVSGMTYPPPPYFTDGTSKTSHCTCKRGERSTKHDYERPLNTGARGQTDGSDDKKTNRRYYELDPDYIASTRMENL